MRWGVRGGCEGGNGAAGACGGRGVLRRLAGQWKATASGLGLPRPQMEGDDEEGGRPDDARSRRSGASQARTARRSEWAHSRIFSDDEGSGEQQQQGGARSKRARSTRGGPGQRGAGRPPRA